MSFCFMFVEQNSEKICASMTENNMYLHHNDRDEGKVYLF